MKRVLFAVFFLAAVIAGCIAAIHLETKLIGEMIDLTDRIEAAYTEGNTEETLQLAQELERQFPQKTKLFFLFLHHNVLTEIEEAIVTLPAYLKSGDSHEFLAQLNRCRLLLQKQIEMETPTWQNVF